MGLGRCASSCCNRLFPALRGGTAVFKRTAFDHVVKIHPSRVGIKRHLRRRHNSTNQERAVVQWAAQSSDTSILEWAAIQQQFAEPLQIHPLTFQPIAIEEINK